MRAAANQIAHIDDYLISKFGKLQAAASLALAEINAIPEATRPDDGHEMILWAIAPVERLAQSLGLVEASTRVGAAMKKRAAAWLAGGDLNCLLEPVGIAA